VTHAQAFCDQGENVNLTTPGLSSKYIHAKSPEVLSEQENTPSRQLSKDN